MTWLKMDDRFPWHRKVRRLSDRAFRLHVEALHLCARDENDGKLTRLDLDDLPTVRGLDKAVLELVAADLWHKTRSGWEIHDYLHYNPSKAQLDAKRAADRERQNRNRKGGRPTPPEPDPAPDDDDLSRRDTARTPTRVASVSQHPVPSRPVPSRPDPSLSAHLRVVRSVETDSSSSGSVRASGERR